MNNQQLFTLGTLTGEPRDAAGNLIRTVNQVIRLPLTSISGTCEILHLELGPVDLNLLGLQVHLDKIVREITAQSGPGKLLGNLLCAIAGLLDNGGPLTALARALNDLLAALGSQNRRQVYEAKR